MPVLQLQCIFHQCVDDIFRIYYITHVKNQWRLMDFKKNYAALLCQVMSIRNIPYSTKRWRGKTLANLAIVHRFVKVFPSKYC